MNTFCTLFDSNYLDKGITLYRSMARVMTEFKLYILAMDELCNDILIRMNLPKAVIISQDAFEDEQLKKIREERSRAEYCWTCTASLIDFIFEQYQEECCTYVDSDLYFYQSPQVLLQEMYDADCSVQIVEHRFGKGLRAKQKEKAGGKYCVQFNTFKNDEKGRNVLTVWKEQCRAHCSMAPGEMGDQKYLNEWAEQYDCVNVLQNHGGGVAPWNINRYRYIENQAQSITFWGKDMKRKYTLVFYHFHHLEYLDEKTVNINVFKEAWKTDRILVKKIYTPYLLEIEEVKEYLNQNYGFSPILRKHPGIVKETGKTLLEKLKGKTLSEIWRKVEGKIVYMIGTRRDIIHINML